MIKLFGRMLPALWRGTTGELLPADQPLGSRFRVLPHDIDLNRHLNNGRYLQLIDVNRMEWLLRTGIAGIIRRERWKPILGATAIQFRRELRLWDEGVATTRLLGWDPRWVYLEHRIETPCGRPVALALARAGFRARGAWVPVERLRAALPYALAAPVLPRQVSAWAALDAELAGAMTNVGGPAPAAMPLLDPV